MPIRLLFRGDRNLLLSLSSSLSDIRRVPVVDVGVGSWRGGILDDGPGGGRVGGGGGAVACEGRAAIGGSRWGSRDCPSPGPGGAKGIPGGGAGIPPGGL